MNSKNVLNRILTLLSMEDKEEKFTYAKLADGTIVESLTFDVGEPVEIVSEDGKSPAPDGTHELTLRDSKGNEVLIKVKTEGGIIVERENVELEEEDEEIKEEAIEEMVAGLIETLTPDEVSSEVAEEIAEKVLDALEDKIEILKKRKLTKMQSIAGADMGGDEDGSAETVPVLPLEDFSKPLQELAYRIEELEKKIKKFEEIKEDEIKKEEEELEDEKLPKLDGAPVEEDSSKMRKFSKQKTTGSSQTMFLSRLYK